MRFGYLTMNGSAILTQPTLVLNRSWQAICTTSVRHAIVLLYRGRAKVISPDTYELHDIDSWADLSKIKSGPKVHGVSFSMPVPEVVILTGCDVYPKPKVVFSRRNIFKRDRFTCVRVPNPRTGVESANLLERPGDSLRIARELDGRGVGKKFSLTRHRALNQFAKEDSDVTNGHEREAD